MMYPTLFGLGFVEDIWPSLLLAHGGGGWSFGVLLVPPPHANRTEPVVCRFCVRQSRRGQPMVDTVCTLWTVFFFCSREVRSAQPCLRSTMA